MNSLLELREWMQQIYAEYSRVIDRAWRLVVNLLVFFMIQTRLGYMPSISKSPLTLAVAAVCTFLPPVCTCIAAAALILLHISSLSTGIMIITAIVFALVFIFYLRFTANRSVALLLTVVSFALNLPALAPVTAGLAGGPSMIIPLICGTVVYYVLHSVDGYAAGLGEDDGLISVLSGFAKEALQNQKMVAAVVGVVFGVMLVYVIRRMAFAYSWQVAIVVGAVVSAVVFAKGGAGFGTGAAAGSAALAAIVGLIIQFMIFNVDYSGTEQVQFEDDEYYYYVKAVPKNVAGKKKGKRR